MPPPNKENTAKFAILQKYNRVIYSRRLHRHHVRQAGSAGEVLILYAKGLGPTTPSVNPGDPYPGAPLAIVNSPVDVLANGKSSPVINQIGLPGTRDIYHVAFRVPNDITAGPARVQISAAWVKGSAVAMPVR